MSEALGLLLTDDALEAIAQRVAALLAEENPARPEPAAFTIAGLAAELGVSPKTIRGAIHRGELAAVRRGAGYLIAADAVRGWATPSPSKPTRRAGRAPARGGQGPLAAALAPTLPPTHTHTERTP